MSALELLLLKQDPLLSWQLYLLHFVAMCNAFSAAQLAANHPVSGGTYEYGYTYLGPKFGFTAGWMFLCAKSASAATAALGFSGYLLHVIGAEKNEWLPILGVVTVVVLTIITLSGLRRSNLTNIIIVSITMLTLAIFVATGLPKVLETGTEFFSPFFLQAESKNPIAGFFTATALMFVAYTGYGRIATLGEEVKDPRTTIPKAIVLTLSVSAIVYILVSIVSVGALGVDVLTEATNKEAAPLEIVARKMGAPGVSQVVAIGAMTAMLGVLLNLILGLSRILLAMGRRKDMPKITARINKAGTTPTVAVVIMGIVIAGLAAIGSVKIAWSFSAFTVLIYYSITNLCALRLKKEQRIYPVVFSWIGFFCCITLAFWVDKEIWLIGLGMIVLGLILQVIMQAVQKEKSS